jgi:hypothetical protein
MMIFMRIKMKKKLNKVRPEVELGLLKDCIARKITQTVCAEILGLSVRQIKRKCKALRSNGILEHGNKGRCPVNRISDDIRNHIIECCKGDYQGFGPTLVSYEYNRMYNVDIAVETARQIMISNELWAAKNKPVKHIHPMRERMSCYGEMVQADGTEYDWLGDGAKHILLVFIDDATSSLLHAVLVKSESTSSYMQALNDYLQKHGRPMCLYTDKHGVFRVNMPSASEDAQTQFARAMEELDIKMIQANSAQAKGRVERANQTLQDRLAKRLRLLGVKTVEEANSYLQDEYIAEYNRLFAVVPASLVNVHRPLEMTHNLEQILSLHNTRIISKNHTVQYNNQVVQIIEEATDLHKKQATVVTKLDEIIRILVSGKAVKFRVLPIRPKQSDVACAKMVNLAVSQARQNLLEAKSALECNGIL